MLRLCGLRPTEEAANPVRKKLSRKEKRQLRAFINLVDDYIGPVEETLSDEIEEQELVSDILKDSLRCAYYWFRKDGSPELVQKMLVSYAVEQIIRYRRRRESESQINQPDKQIDNIRELTN